MGNDYSCELRKVAAKPQSRNLQIANQNMIQDTSLHAYALFTQNLTFRQKEVLDRLRYFPDVTNMEARHHLSKVRGEVLDVHYGKSPKCGANGPCRISIARRVCQLGSSAGQGEAWARALSMVAWFLASRTWYLRE